MDKFEASNGVKIEREEWRLNIACSGGDYPEGHHLSVSETTALREFFRAERDEELGRWRSKADPDYVVHADPDGDGVSVLNERTGSGAKYSRAICEGTSVPMDGLHAAAHAYFEAHPERKPWEDAKPGEVWVVKWLNSANPEEVVIVRPGGWDKNWAVDSARRIWPEVS